MGPAYNKGVPWESRVQSPLIHGTIVCLPDIGSTFMVNVGRYTSPMDPMGLLPREFPTLSRCMP